MFKYIYTASMDVKDNQLEDTLRVGIFLGITEVKDVILEILSRPTFDNVEVSMIRAVLKGFFCKLFLTYNRSSNLKACNDL